MVALLRSVSSKGDHNSKGGRRHRPGWWCIAGGRV